MRMVHRIEVRFTRTQLERVRQNAQRKGFLHLSEYMRHAALDEDFFVLFDRVHEIHRHLIGNTTSRGTRSIHREP